MSEPDPDITIIGKSQVQRNPQSDDVCTWKIPDKKRKSLEIKRIKFMDSSNLTPGIVIQGVCMIGSAAYLRKHNETCCTG